DLAYPTLPIAIQNAGMDDLRVIADEFQDGVPGYYTFEFMVLADGPMKRVEDLKGKAVATNAAGSAVDISSAPCFASTPWRTSAITPLSKRHFRPCAPYSPRKRWTSFQRRCHLRLTRS